jgi:preprotein translocase subunit SecF
LSPNEPFKDVLDRALTITLGRTIITTLTTLLTVWAIFFFTKGSMKDFALALMIGMTSGVYSTIYVASAFVYWWDGLRIKRQKKFQGRPTATTKIAPPKGELGADAKA